MVTFFNLIVLAYWIAFLINRCLKKKKKVTTVGKTFQSFQKVAIIVKITKTKGWKYFTLVINLYNELSEMTDS